MVDSSKDEWGEDKLEITFRHTSKLYEKYPWFCEVSGRYTIE